MALSEYERKMLEELEAQLSDEDPGFADSLKPASPGVSASKQLSVRHLVLGLLVAILGVGVLVAGVATELVVIGVLGVVVMFAGTWYVIEGIQERPGAQRVKRKGEPPRQGPASSSRPTSRFSEFMSRQAQEWERRRRENGRG